MKELSKEKFMERKGLTGFRPVDFEAACGGYISQDQFSRWFRGGMPKSAVGFCWLLLDRMNGVAAAVQKMWEDAAPRAGVGTGIKERVDLVWEDEKREKAKVVESPDGKYLMGVDPVKKVKDAMYDGEKLRKAFDDEFPNGAASAEDKKKLYDDLRKVKGGQLSSKVGFVPDTDGAYDGSGVNPLHIDEMATMPDLGNVEKGLHTTTVEGMEDEVMAVKLEPHGSGVMYEHPEDMVWWRDRLYIYFHISEGVCGKCLWSMVRDHSDYEVLVSGKHYLFSKFTKK